MELAYITLYTEKSITIINDTSIQFLFQKKN